MTKITEGQPFPEFSLKAAIPDGENIKESTLGLAELKGQPFVLFVYPKDATSGCTIEVCGFRDLYPEFEKSGIRVLGLSRDTVRSHVRFIEAQNLPYPLLADKELTIIRDWDLLKNATMYGKPVTKVARTTFVADAEGIVQRIFENVTPLGHAQEVLDAARKTAS